MRAPGIGLKVHNTPRLTGLMNTMAVTKPERATKYNSAVVYVTQVLRITNAAVAVRSLAAVAFAGSLRSDW